MTPDTFLYTVDTSADEPIMLIDKHIGFDEAEGFGIMGDLFQKELLALDAMGKKRIQVWINSPGGIVADGYNIHNAILKSKTPVDTYCTGLAASIAGVVFLAGRRRIMADYAQLMYHNPFGGDDDKGLAAIRDSIVTMIASRCGKEEADIVAIMNKTTWIGAKEALDAGFCDEVQDSSLINKKRSVSISTDVKAFWKEAADITNSLLPVNQTHTKNFTMKKIANRLKLNPEASEDAVVEAIDSLEKSNADLQNQVKNHLSEIQNKKNSLEEQENKVKALEEELTKAKNELKEAQDKAKNMEEEQEKKEEEDKATKAKNLVEGFAKQGRIKNDAKILADWTEQAKADYDGVKNLLESLPLNQKAAAFETKTTGEFKGGSVISNFMVKRLAEAKAKA
ncbi:MAG: Clp protease ClpP [Pseudobacter sp.]|uniref:Clp protease ClpP n=1 Tax=Pseudobacter sp. TaxID=2045420 RepID=UPI003F7F7DA4